uniref:BTB domain-containing protein n=1 Tax=Panagrellus redivivus TaxID=6233 RepID=A0A7E4ZSH9_PANRE
MESIDKRVEELSVETCDENYSTETSFYMTEFDSVSFHDSDESAKSVKQNQQFLEIAPENDSNTIETVKFSENDEAYIVGNEAAYFQLHKAFYRAMEYAQSENA